jgi:hypothetical protein
MMLSKPLSPLKKCVFITALFIFFSTALYADDSLEARVEKLEQAVQVLQAQLATLRAPAIAAAAEAADVGAGLFLRAWSFREVQVKFNTFHALDLDFYNGYDKTIRDIDARLDFKDSLGEHLYSIRLGLSQEIPPATEITDQGTATNKRLFGRGAVLEKISRQNVHSELHLRRIVFSDGSIETF